MNKLLNLISTLPKYIFVTTVFVVGILSFFILQPPYSACDSQIKEFKKTQAGNIFSSRTKKSVQSPKIRRYLDLCKKSLSPGGCYELFLSVRKMLSDSKLIPSECASTLEEISVVKKYLKTTVELMALIAWGDKPPSSADDKNGWLQLTDLYFFCEVKKEYQRFFGEDSWNDLALSLYKELPGEASIFESGVCVNCQKRKPANQLLSSDEIWKKIIFSTDCRHYQL